MTNKKITQIRPEGSFIMLDEHNTAIVSLSDPRPNNWDVEEIATLADPKAIAQVVLNYAVRRCLPPSMVELSIRWPDDPATDMPDDLVFLKPQTD